MVNAENASLKAPKFSKPNDRAHHALFDDMMEEFGSKNKKSLVDSDTPISPIRKMFSAHMSIGKKSRNMHGSLNELSTEKAACAKASTVPSLGPSKYQPTHNLPKVDNDKPKPADNPRVLFKPTGALQVPLRSSGKSHGLTSQELNTATFLDPSPLDRL